MNFYQLEQLWIAQGGSQAWAPIMAAIAMAESTGDPSNTTGDNGTSYGLWQIHWTVHPQFNPSQLTNAAYNTQAAIQLSGNGAGLASEGDQTPWTTFNSWIRGDGGYGDQVISKYLGPYTGTLPTSAASSAPAASSSSPYSSASSSSASSASSSTSTGPSWLDQIGQIKLGPFAIGTGAEQVVAAGIVGAGALVLLFIGGLWLLLGNDKTRTIIVNTAKTAAEAAE